MAASMAKLTAAVSPASGAAADTRAALAAASSEPAPMTRWCWPGRAIDFSGPPQRRLLLPSPLQKPAAPAAAAAATVSARASALMKSPYVSLFSLKSRSWQTMGPHDLTSAHGPLPFPFAPAAGQPESSTAARGSSSGAAAEQEQVEQQASAAVSRADAGVDSSSSRNSRAYELSTADEEQNRIESMVALSALGRSLDSLPTDLADAVERGRIPGEIINRLALLEESRVLNYLLRFGGFKERLLADDLFLTKLAIECGVGICTKTSAEYERRRAMFFPEFDFVIADVIMAIIADFMLVWLPAPTVALQPALPQEAGQLQKFLATCPDNAFQVPLRGESYSLLQRVAAILRNGAKLFAVGTFSSLFGTALTNAIIFIRHLLSASAPAALPLTVPATAAVALLEPTDVDHILSAAAASADLSAAAATGAVADAVAASAAVADAVAATAAVASTAAAAAAAAAAGVIPAPSEVEVPILSTSLAYGAYMALSSNLRYQIVAGVIEQRFLEPMFHDRKLTLSGLSFVVRTGNTFLGSLLWVDFARWVGVQSHGG